MKSISKKSTIWDLGVGSESLVTLTEMLSKNEISLGGVRRVIDILIAEGGEALEVIERENFRILDNKDDLESIILEVLVNYPNNIKQIKLGKASAIGPIIGHVMRVTQGRANGSEVKDLIERSINENY